MKKNLLKFISILSLTTFTPLIAFAQSTSLTDVVSKISDLFGAILPVLVSLGVIYFIWGVITYFIADSDEAKTKGRDRIIYGIIGLAVIISVWGIVTLLGDTLGVGQQAAPTKISNLTPTSGAACDFRESTFPGYLNYFTCLIGSSVIPFLFAVAVVMFIWGAIKFFIIDADEEAKRAQGKQFMIWGIIALAVMISVWGLVGVLGQTFHINTQFLPQVKP